MITPYEKRNIVDHSGITFEQITAAERTPLCSSAASLHRHGFFELTLVLRGSCSYFSDHGRTPLIPGDLLLMPPHQPHACYLQRGAELCHCQFESDVLSGALSSLLSDMIYCETPAKNVAQKRLHDLTAFEEESRVTGDPLLLRSGNATPSGMLHLSHSEFSSLYPILQSICQEQKEQRFGFEPLKVTRLQELIVLLKRVQICQFELLQEQSSWKEELIGTVLTQIDNDLAREMDFEGIAHKQGITLSYFRMVFKEITGMPPTDYLNRVRILRALELLQTCDAPVSEIAAKVGIYDANYFSRLFKKVTGYPPRYFKSISRHIS